MSTLGAYWVISAPSFLVCDLDRGHHASFVVAGNVAAELVLAWLGERPGQRLRLTGFDVRRLGLLAVDLHWLVDVTSVLDHHLVLGLADVRDHEVVGLTDLEGRQRRGDRHIGQLQPRR